MELFAQRLRELREERGLSIRELARRLNVNHTTISRWESGKTEAPEWSTMKKIADFFGVPVSYLLGAEQIDLKKALEEVEITWGGKKLTEEQKQMCREILESMLKRILPNGGHN